MTASGKTVVVRLERVQEGDLGMWRSCIEPKFVGQLNSTQLGTFQSGHGTWQSTTATVLNIS